jgi:glucose-specific phosphotransferase system IIA component
LLQEADFMLLGKESKYIDRPVSGECVPIENVKDPAFAQKMMGEGFAILPEENIVRSPITGTLTLTNMAHAFIVTGDNDEEVLVHVGIDTVKLKGKGFRFLAKPDQHVAVGTPVVEFDREAIAQQGYDTTVVVAFSNFDEYDLEANLLNQENHVMQYQLR